MSIASKDLVALVADKHQEATLLGLLARPESLPIRPITCQIYVDSGNDPGCRTRGPEFLRLANALSALYPTGSEEKRLLDAMLLAVPR